MQVIQIEITESVYTFIKRYYSAPDIGQKLLEAISDGFVYPNGKNFSLTSQAAKKLQEYLDQQSHQDMEYYSDI